MCIRDSYSRALKHGVSTTNRVKIYYHSVLLTWQIWLSYAEVREMRRGSSRTKASIQSTALHLIIPGNLYRDIKNTVLRKEQPIRILSTITVRKTYHFFSFFFSYMFYIFYLTYLFYYFKDEL